MTGFRGRTGELTVRVASGDASRWGRLTRVEMVPPGEGSDDAATYPIETSRTYRDRLVLKLRGVDDPTAADALKGHRVLAPADEVPELPEGVYYMERLLGLVVEDEDSTVLGTVVDVTETAGSSILTIRETGGEELLVPLAEEVVVSVREKEGRITVRLPEGLRGLNPATGKDRGF